MTEPELEARIRASRNQPPLEAGVPEDWPDAPYPYRLPGEGPCDPFAKTPTEIALVAAFMAIPALAVWGLILWLVRHL